MAGSRNNTQYSAGYNVEPTTSDDITTLQLTTDATSIYNVTGNPEGVYNANVGTIAMDRTSGETYRKHTGSGNTGWEALAPYVKGTFTPGLSFGGGTTGIVYMSQVGVYTRIANVVHFSLTITITSKGSSTGAAKITGLPIASLGSGVICVIDGDGVTPVSTYFGNIMNFDSSTTTATLYSFTNATGNTISPLDDTNFANASTVRATGIYFV